MKKVFIVFLAIIFVYFIASLIIYFIDSKPILDNVFENGINLEENQELSKNNLSLYDIKNNESFLLDFNKNDTINLYFFNQSYKKISFKGIENDLKKLNIKKPEKTYIIFTDTLNLDTKKLPVKNNYYKLNIDSIPFKYNKLMYPYKVVIYNNNIIKSTLNIYE
jgi:hypothetical protein